MGYQIFRASECARACSFTTWMWQRRPRRAALQTRVDLRRAARRGGAGLVARDTGIAQRPECGVASAAMRVRISLPVPSFPSSNGEDRGPSSRVCRFKSGRERQRGCSSADRAFASQAKGAGLNPAVSTNSSRRGAAGRARRSGRRGRRFESCRRDHEFPSSSADGRARGYEPAVM